MHPYHKVPLTSVWSRSVATNFDPLALVTSSTRLVRPHERVASAGSCFAANLVPYLEHFGLTYLRTESLPPALSRVAGEHAGYDAFSARYGHIYTVRQLLQLFKRSMGLLTPIEDRWHTPAVVIDPFRPGLRYHALTDREFDLLTAQHLRAVRRMFEQMHVFIFTLGLTEAWVSRADGCVFPACPGTVAGEFDEARHAFVNFAYEIVTGVQAPASFFKENLRDVTTQAIHTVMLTFLSHCQLDVLLPTSAQLAGVKAFERPAPAEDTRQRLSAAIAARECEEVQQDVYR